MTAAWIAAAEAADQSARVEVVKLDDGGAVIRHSADPLTPLILDRNAWECFKQGIRMGDFD